MSEDNGSSLGITTPIGSITANGLKRTSEIIAILSLCIMAVLAYAFWTHTVDARDSDKEISGQLEKDREQRTKSSKEMREQFGRSQQQLVDAIRNQSKEVKIQTCILSLPQDQRQAQFDNPNSLCNRLAR